MRPSDGLKKRKVSRIDARQVRKHVEHMHTHTHTHTHTQTHAHTHKWTNVKPSSTLRLVAEIAPPASRDRASMRYMEA